MKNNLNYEILMNVRKNGDWETWLKFFLKGIAETSDQAIETAKKILELKAKLSDLFKSVSKRRDNYQLLIDDLFENLGHSKDTTIVNNN